VRFNADWSRNGGWLFPDSVMERMAPYAASGGALGPDGYLYIMGHDRPEMYVLARPKQGPVLVHIATIDLDGAGQAFSFDPEVEGRVWIVDRPEDVLRQIALPPMETDHPSALPFAR